MKVLNKYKESPETIQNAVCIMRGTPFGNPFVIGVDGDRIQVIEKYKEYFNKRILTDEGFTSELRSLYNSGKDVYCCCKPLPCHGDVIVEFFEIYGK